MQTGAGEDVEAVMARLAAQGAENAALKERQSKLDKDQQVSVLQPGCATSSRTLLAHAPCSRADVSVICMVVPPVADHMSICFAWLCRWWPHKYCHLVVPVMAETVPVMAEPAPVMAEPAPLCFDNLS